MKQAQTKTTHRLANTVLAYQWGMPAGIAERLKYNPLIEGTTTDKRQPQAELWIGAHPKAPSKILPAANQISNKNTYTLADYEKDNKTSLPYLFKLLAVNEALSIQAHPTKEKAAAGFDRENQLGIPIEAKNRNFRDPNAKPELIVALENGFEALCGFRPEIETQVLLSALAAHPSLTQSTRECLKRFAKALKDYGIREIVAWALDAAHKYRAHKPELISSIATASLTHVTVPTLINNPVLTRATSLLAKLSTQYPGDPGLIVALLLNQVSLQHGQALWLPPGTPHAYLGGYGIEIMGPSDNVLRGGLTPKHIDSIQLLNNLNFAETAAPLFTPKHYGNYKRFAPDKTGRYSRPFELLQISADATLKSQDPVCTLVTAGSFTVSTGSGDYSCYTGDSLFIPDGKAVITGRGEMFAATGKTKR